MESTTVTGAGAIAAFLLAPLLTLLVDASYGRVSRRGVLSSVVVAAASGLCWLAVVVLTAPQLDPRLTLPLAGVAGIAAVLGTVPIRRHRLPKVVGIAVASTATVFAPVAIALFSVADGVLGSALGTLDLGGACAALVASGSSLSVLLVLRRREPVERPGRAGRLVVPVFIAVWVCWITWLVGLELVVDEVTPRIIANAVIGPIASTVAWLVVERVRHARTTALGAVGGLFCGLVAMTAGCGYLDPLGAILTGGIAGLSCSVIGYGLARRTGRPEWLLAVVLTVGSSAGIVLLGVFATRSGLMFTGQPEVLFSQFASVALVTVYATAVSVALWGVGRVVDTRARRTPASPRS